MRQVQVQVQDYEADNCIEENFCTVGFMVFRIKENYRAVGFVLRRVIAQ